jgi:c-di-GMP-binding flagellar brake protein YcgR
MGHVGSVDSLLQWIPKSLWELFMPLTDTRSRPTVNRERLPVEMPRQNDLSSATTVRSSINEFKDRRRKRRVPVQPMYSFASIRVLSRQDGPMEGHVINLSETGMVVEIDNLIAVGQAITAEFSIAGLGRAREDHWPTYAVAAEVVRVDDVTDFPMGPYRTALRFVRIPTIAQAQIARFIVTQPERVLV